MDVEILSSSLSLRLHNTDNLLKHFPQGDQLRCQCHLSALYLGHVQHIINQPQKMLTGQGNFLQTVAHLLLVVDMSRGNRSHAHNGIHRCADIVAHVGQEYTLCLRCLQGFLPRRLQIFQLLARHFKIDIKNQQQKKENHSQNDHRCNRTVLVQTFNRFVQAAKRQYCYQIPFRVRQRRTVYLLDAAIQIQCS